MTTREEWDVFARESVPLLHKLGYLKKRQFHTKNWILPATLFIIGVMFGGIFIYAISNDSFKSEFNQEIDPNVSVNTENQYDFAPITENEYEFIDNRTIINNVIIPSDLCGGGE